MASTLRPTPLPAARRVTPGFDCRSAPPIPCRSRIGFCLYLVDRSLLQRVVAEADRVLANGGLLAILDFDPDVPCARPYHHRPGLMSYKMDYAALFLANPAYVLVDKLSTSHTTGQWDPDPQERVALSLSRKNLEQAYKAV